MALVWHRTVARKSSVGRLYVCAGGLDILKIDKLHSFIAIGGLELCFGGLRLPKPPSYGDRSGVADVKATGKPA